jgi:hypothetical protein
MKAPLLSLLLIPGFVFAQKTIDVDKTNASPVRDGLFYTVSGTPFSNYKYIRVVSGSPYFNEDWMKGIVIISNGARARCDFIKLDLLTGDLLYKDSTDNELVATTPVKQLTLTEPVSGKECVFLNSSFLNLTGEDVSGWYEVLESGTVLLYKKIKKSVSESKPYNSATTEQTINTTNQYFVVVGKSITPVKKPKDIVAVLADKENLLNQFISSNKLNGKTDADFSAVVAHYNSLTTNQ